MDTTAMRRYRPAATNSEVLPERACRRLSFSPVVWPSRAAILVISAKLSGSASSIAGLLKLLLLHSPHAAKPNAEVHSPGPLLELWTPDDAKCGPGRVEQLCSAFP